MPKPRWRLRWLLQNLLPPNSLPNKPAKPTKQRLPVLLKRPCWLRKKQRAWQRKLALRRLPKQKLKPWLPKQPLKQRWHKQLATGKAKKLKFKKVSLWKK